MRGIGLAADIADHAVAAPTALAHLEDGLAKCLAGGGPAPHDGRAVGANDDPVERPAMGRQVEGSGADQGFQLGRSAVVCEPEGFGVDGPPSNENGQATPGPAIFIQRGVYVNDEALSQAAILLKRLV